jgi:Bacterial SH3 domain
MKGEVRVNRVIILAKQFCRLLLVGGLTILLTAPGTGLAQSFKTVQSKQQLYAEPNFSANAQGSIPEGSEVQIVQQSGDWYQVEYQGQQGWLPQQAFPGGKKFELSNLLKGKAVQESKTDEVALAGKGFTPEVEAGYRQSHPNLNYAQVDQVEKFEVSSAQLQAFQREGGLR